MYQDYLTKFCADTALVNSTGTFLLGSQYDTGITTSDLGGGEPIWLYVVVKTATTVSTSTGTLTIKLASDDSASISTTTSTIHVVSATLTGAQSAGTVVYKGILPSGTYERYLGILGVYGTESTLTGTIDAGLVLSAPRQRIYPDAI